MSDYDFIKMQKKLAKYLDENRYEHTLGVMFTCASLAMVHGYDLKNAQVAGLLHDSAKCIPNKKKLKICAEHHIPFRQICHLFIKFLNRHMITYCYNNRTGFTYSCRLSP